MKARIVLWWAAMLLFLGIGIVLLHISFSAFGYHLNLELLWRDVLVSICITVVLFGIAGRWFLEDHIEFQDQSLVNENIYKRELTKRDRHLNIYRQMMNGRVGICVVANTDPHRVFSGPVDVSQGSDVTWEKLGDLNIFYIAPDATFTITMQDEREKLLAQVELKSSIGEMILIGYEDWLTSNLPYGVTAGNVIKVGAGMAYVTYRMPILSLSKEVPSN